jgi:hypothetical protein
MNSGLFEYAEPKTAVIVMAAWLFTMFVLIINTAMVFLYRYKILCKQYSFTMKKFSLIYALLVCYAAVHSFACLITAQTDLNENNYGETLAKTHVFADNPPTPVIFNAVSPS